MKFLVLFFIAFFILKKSHAQYFGSNGRGDVQLQKTSLGLNAEDISVLYHGGNGRGDIQTIKSLLGINGENVSTLYRGGNGRGDALSDTALGIADCAIILYWNGSKSNLWENPLNWNCNELPGINSNVVIPSRLLVYPVVNSTTEIKRLELRPGSTVTIIPGVILKVNGR